MGNVDCQLQPWSEHIQATLLAELETARPDLIFHLGDLTCGGGSFNMPTETFFATLEATYEAFQAQPADFLALPGNHDCPPGGDWSYAEKRFGLGPGLGQTIDLPTARLVLLNAQGHPPEQISAAWPDDPTSGWVNEAELARLAEALATADERPVLLFLHQVLKPWVGAQPWQGLYGIENADAVLTVLEKAGNVRAVFQGHAHRLDVQQAKVGPEACWFIVGPAIIEYPLAWLQLDLTPTQLHVSVQRLPLSDLATLSLEQGEDRSWRAGQPAWQDFSIPLS